MELNQIILHSIRNGWSRKTYVKGSDFEAVNLKHAINIFEGMEIADFFDEGVVQPSYNKSTRSKAIHDGHIAGRKAADTPFQREIQIWGAALEIARKGVYNAQVVTHN